MEDKKIEILYEMIIANIPINDQNLIRYGFTEEEINQLLEERIIIAINHNEYKIYSLYELYYYGHKLLSLKESAKANICFQKCHQLSPNNRDFILQLFLRELKLGDYTLAFEKFSIMEKIEAEKNRANNNLYLYLLSMLTSCAEEYKERLKQIDYDSVLLPNDSEEYNKEQINNIAHAIMKGKYEYALELLNTLLAHEPIRLTSNGVLKELLTQVLNQEHRFFSNLLAFANNKRYHVIASFLATQKQKRYLSNKETYIYMLSKSIVDIINTKTIPEIMIDNTKCIYEAIKGNNFALARKINRKILRHEKRTLENEIIDILLKDINQLIYELKQEEQDLPPQNNQFEEELANYLQAENIPFEEATKKYNLTDEQILLIKLIYARNYYTEEMYLLGDTLLKEVEKSIFKTPKVIKLLNEIRINKKFYKNRRENPTRKRSIFNTKQERKPW